MKTLFATAAALGWSVLAHAQSTNSFPLWPGGAPGALGDKPKDIPTLTPFFPEPGAATGAAMIVCPGGSYVHLAPHEGDLYARWLAEHGIAAFVLKYRLGSDGYHHPAMMQDGLRAVRVVRANAAAWKLDPHRIGMIGSSAGGHLTSTVMTHYDAGDPKSSDPIERVSSRPDLGILCYAVITMGEFAHKGSRDALLGKNPSPELLALLSNELHVTKDTPPCFLWATDEDKTVPVENTLEFAMALRRAGVPFDLHIYQRGAHGLGLGSHKYEPEKFLPWTADCLYWLREQKFLK